VHFGDDAAARNLARNVNEFHMLRSVTGLGNVVFGTDYPYPRDAISIAGLRQLQRTAELDDDERRAVLGASAARVIPRLARTALPAAYGGQAVVELPGS
jgi:predicted TIM-barrel fold metal-dependent hydrolase